MKIKISIHVAMAIALAITFAMILKRHSDISYKNTEWIEQIIANKDYDAQYEPLLKNAVNVISHVHHDVGGTLVNTLSRDGSASIILLDYDNISRKYDNSPAWIKFKGNLVTVDDKYIVVDSGFIKLLYMYGWNISVSNANAETYIRDAKSHEEAYTNIVERTYNARELNQLNAVGNFVNVPLNFIAHTLRYCRCLPMSLR